MPSKKVATVWPWTLEMDGKMYYLKLVRTSIISFRWETQKYFRYIYKLI